jgi:hypothetical protein
MLVFGEHHLLWCASLVPLCLQAHYNAQAHSDEFVLELLLSLDKLSVLVQELLVIEVGAWPRHDCYAMFA